MYIYRRFLQRYFFLQWTLDIFLQWTFRHFLQWTLDIFLQWTLDIFLQWNLDIFLQWTLDIILRSTRRFFPPPFRVIKSISRIFLHPIYWSILTSKRFFFLQQLNQVGHRENVRSDGGRHFRIRFNTFLLFVKIVKFVKGHASIYHNMLDFSKNLL
jgi:hypothetical protein